jgi:HK97 family phage portal protein
MAFGDRIKAAGQVLVGRSVPAMTERREPRMSSMGGAGVTFNLNDPAFAEYLRSGGSRSTSGAIVNDFSVLSIATAWRCSSLICGVIGSLPCDVNLRVGEGQRQPAINEPFRELLTVRPNNRQTPAEFKMMLQLHKLQRGNGYAMKIRSAGRIVALWPLDPNRMAVIENADASLTYRYSRKDGTSVDFAASEILHLRGLSWDGVTGLSVIRYMAEAAGLALQARTGAAKMLRNGQLTPGYLKSPNALSDKAYERLTGDLEHRAGVDSDDAGKMQILEEGLEFQAAGLTADDAQLVGLMGFSRTDVGMFYGVPPHLYGDTDKSTSWGSGIEQQNLGFLQYTIQPHLTDWTEVLKRDVLSEKGMDPRLYVHFDLKGFLRADAAGRSAYLARALGGGGSRPWMTQNEARAAEDLPPSKEKWADQLPEIGAGKITETVTTDGKANPDPQTA